MKKIKYVIGSLIITVIFSCNNDDSKQVFNQSALERLKSRAQEDQNILTSAENGWITRYRPDKDFGYFNLWFQFNKDGTVHTLSDIPLVNKGNWRGGIFAPQPGFYKDTTTHYRVSSQHSVDLVFEDPMALHYLYSLTNSDGEEFKSGAEFEFYITRSTPEEVVLESKTDSGKGKQQKTQMILKKATPEDKRKVEKSYAAWDKLLLQENTISPNILFISEEEKLLLHVYSNEIVKRISKNGEEISPGPYYIKIKKDEGKDIMCQKLMIKSSSLKTLVLPKGEDLIIKFAETGKAINPAEIALERVTYKYGRWSVEEVNTNQVGVYTTIYNNTSILLTVLKIGSLQTKMPTVFVYDPAIIGTDVSGSYYDIDPSHTDMQENTPRRGKIYLVEGTKNIFFATDLGFKGDFPVYFQMNGDKASFIHQDIPQNDAFQVKNIDLTYDPVKRQFHEVIHFIEVPWHGMKKRPDSYYTYQIE